MSKTPKNKALTVRCFTDEYALLTKASKRLRISLSDFVRLTLLARAKRVLEK